MRLSEISLLEKKTELNEKIFFSGIFLFGAQGVEKNSKENNYIHKLILIISTSDMSKTIKGFSEKTCHWT